LPYSECDYLYLPCRRRGVCLQTLLASVGVPIRSRDRRCVRHGGSPLRPLRRRSWAVGWLADCHFAMGDEGI